MRSIIYIGIVISALSCTPSEFRPATGDLLFQAGRTSQMGGAIEAATGAKQEINFTHVAIAIANQGTDSVLEATTDGGVRLTSLREFLDQSTQIGDRPVVEVMRLRDTTGVMASVARARKQLGQPYDYSFLPKNEKMYCSELIWESYLDADGAPLFTSRPMNFRAPDGTLPQFWVELFGRLGEPVPEGVPGTNPNEMAKEPALVSVHRYY